MAGCQVRSGLGHSIPASSIDNSARLRDAFPLSACGHTNRPRSSLFEDRQRPSPSNQSSLIRSPRRPRTQIRDRTIFLAISIGLFNQLAGVSAILYYLNDIFLAGGFSKISGDQQAVAIGLMNLFAILLGMSGTPRILSWLPAFG